MWRSFFRDSGLLSRILQLLFLFFFFSLVVTALIAVLFGSGQQPETLRLQMILQRIFMFILPPLLVAYLWFDKPFSWLRLNKFPGLWQIVSVVVLSVVIVPFVNVLTALNAQMALPEWLSGVSEWMRTMEDSAAGLTNQLLNVNEPALLVQNMILVAVIPAIGEELFFRGGIQNIISDKKNIHLAVWISAFVFSAIHLQFYGFIPRMLLGGMYGYLLFWSGSLWLPVIAHFVNNGMAVLVYYLRYNGSSMPDPDTLGHGQQWWMAVVSALCTGALLFFLFKTRKEDAS
jgi:membrane protease YdiL (CAAX protease family)